MTETDWDKLTVQERAKYQAIWTSPEYRRKCHGLEIWQRHRDLLGPRPARALDIGCGLGRLFAAWNRDGIDGWGIDIADNSLEPEVAQAWGHKRVLGCLWEMDWPERFDLGICADVMEHIPEERVRFTLERIAAACRRTVLQIAEFPSHHLGHTLHLTIKPRDWWVRQAEVFGAVRVLELEGDGRPKHYLMLEAP